MMSADQFRTFEDYVPADISWCPEIPAHWKTAPLRMLFDESRRKNRDRSNQNYLSLMAGVGVLPYAEKGDIGNKMPEDLANCKIVDPDDFVLNSMNFGIGSFGRSKYHGVCSSVYVILKAKDVSHLSYYERVFQHPQFQRFSQSLGNGILVHRCAIGWEELKNAHFPVPPAEEITAIAAFLDDKCAKIEGAVKIKEDQIALLRERRQIIIQDAVTRGLNPAAPMKDSGIDWIGQIPAHWDLLPLKRMFFEKNERTKTGTEVLLSLRMNDGLVPHDDVSDKPLGPDDLKEYKKVVVGQLVMNRMRASIGIFGLADADGIVSPDYAIFDMKAGLDGQFFLHLFKTGLMGQQFRVSSRGLGTGSSGFMRLYTDDFGAISVAVPPNSEQREIVAYIQDNSAQINDAVAIKERQIAALKEYKTSLINAAVTGKIKVI